jgi:hypothetical protein
MPPIMAGRIQGRFLALNRFTDAGPIARDHHQVFATSWTNRPAFFICRIHASFDKLRATSQQNLEVVFPANIARELPLIDTRDTMKRIPCKH